MIGTTVRLNKDPFTIVGVAPPSFHGTEQFVWPDYFIPIVNYVDADYLADRTGRPLTVLGRVKPGVTPQQAAENLSAIAAQLAKEHPKTDTGLPVRLVRPGLYADNGDVIRGFLYAVSALVLLVLLAACANLASLFAARAADRSRELAVRIALGASRARLIRQLMTEATMLSLLGGAAGFVTARLLLRALSRWQDAPFLAASVDARVYLAALAFSLLSALLFGTIPSRQVWQSSALQAMKSGATDSVTLRRFALRDLLLGAQIAICMLLVTASFASVRSMVRTLGTPLGFEPQGAILAEVDVSMESRNQPLEKKKAMLDAVRSIPGVTAAGTSNKPPFTGGLRGIPVFPPGTTEFTLKNSVLAPYGFTISPGYLEAARSRLVQGRDFSWRDNGSTPPVAIVNATFARRMWGDTPPIGQRFIFLGKLREVVGVVEDGKYHELTEAAQAAVFLPLSQNEQSWPAFVVRANRPHNEMTQALERTLSAFAPDAPVTAQSWSDAMEYAISPARTATVALGVMGVLAALLAVTGIFGMAAYNVSRRMKELGIRVALGARARHVLTAAVGRPIVLLGIGSLLGLLTAVFADRLLAQIVYQPNPKDPAVALTAILTMALLGIAASAITALRALAVDPSKLMREE